MKASPICIHVIGFPEKDGEPPQKILRSPRKRCIPNKLIVVDDDRSVQIFDLPDLGRYKWSNSSAAVAKSRLFLMGGYNINDPACCSGDILSVKIDGTSTSWEISPHGDEVGFAAGASVSGDGNSIYGIGVEGTLFSIDPETMALKINIADDPSVLLDLLTATCNKLHSLVHPRLLSVTDTRVYVNCFFQFGANPDFTLLGYYDIQSLIWHTIDTKARLDNLRNLRSKVVVVRDSYIIDFSLWHPVRTLEFRPGLYVYDIYHRVWLTEPVEGLENDGHTLPSLDGHAGDVGLLFNDLSLLQVSRGDGDELKLALVWRYVIAGEKESNVLHVSKFILTIEESVVPSTSEDVVPPTSEDVVPPTSEDVVPPTSEDVVPPTSEDVVPPTSEDVVPPTSEDVLLSPEDDFGFANFWTYIPKDVLSCEDGDVPPTPKDFVPLTFKAENVWSDTPYYGTGIIRMTASD